MMSPMYFLQFRVKALCCAVVNMYLQATFANGEKPSIPHSEASEKDYKVGFLNTILFREIPSFALLRKMIQR